MSLIKCNACLKYYTSKTQNVCCKKSLIVREFCRKFVNLFGVKFSGLQRCPLETLFNMYVANCIVLKITLFGVLVIKLSFKLNLNTQ